MPVELFAFVGNYEPHGYRAEHKISPATSCLDLSNPSQLANPTASRCMLGYRYSWNRVGLWQSANLDLASSPTKHCVLKTIMMIIEPIVILQRPTNIFPANFLINHMKSVFQKKTHVTSWEASFNSNSLHCLTCFVWIEWIVCPLFVVSMLASRTFFPLMYYALYSNPVAGNGDSATQSSSWSS